VAGACFAGAVGLKEGSPMGKLVAIAFSLCLMSLVLALAMAAVGQQPASLVAKANGEGTIKLGKEEFKLDAVVVKLFEDGKAEIQLITDITVFIQGSWARSSDTSRDLDITITGNITSKSLDGGGKLYLSEDRKSITSLKLEVVNKISKKLIKVDFVAK
jgi:hypothetical protein